MLGPNPLAHPMAPNPQELATARANAEDEGREGTAKQQAAEQRLLEVLQPLHAEAEYLLRIPLSSAELLRVAQERVAAALAFEATLTRLAADRKVLKGQVGRRGWKLGARVWRLAVQFPHVVALPWSVADLPALVG